MMIGYFDYLPNAAPPASATPVKADTAKKISGGSPR
jgi:hypothetical protein